MELLPPPDLFDSFDVNLWTAEILHREERDCDWALTHQDQMPLEWREEGNHEEIGEFFPGNKIEGKTEDRKAYELECENKFNEPKTAYN